MSKSQRDKGARFERQICAVIREVTGYNALRNLRQTRDGGFDIAFGKFRIECKARKALSIYSFLDQCQAACKPGDIPVVIAKADRRSPVVIMSLEDLLPILAGELSAVDYEDANDVDA